MIVEMLLTEAQVKIVRLLLGGKRRKNIADELGITVGTLGSYIARIRNRLEIDNDAQLGAWAQRMGLC